MFATIVKLLVGNLVVALMFGVGLATKPEGFADLRRRPALYAKALGVMWIGVPLLTLVVVALTPLRPAPAELLLVMAICPGAPFIPNSARAGHERFSTVGLNVLLLTALTAPFLVPLWATILSRLFPFEFEITGVQVFAKSMPSVIVPLLAGVALRRFAPRVARRLARPVHYFFLAAAVAAIVVALYLGAPVFRHVAPQVYLATVIVLAGSAVMGYLAGAPELPDRRTIGVSAALGNPGLALAVIAASHADFQATAFVMAYVLFRLVAMVVFKRWVDHHERHVAGALPGTA